MKDWESKVFGWRTVRSRREKKKTVARKYLVWVMECILVGKLDICGNQNTINYNESDAFVVCGCSIGLHVQALRNQHITWNRIFEILFCNILGNHLSFCKHDSPNAMVTGHRARRWVFCFVKIQWIIIFRQCRPNVCRWFVWRWQIASIINILEKKIQEPRFSSFFILPRWIHAP